MNKKENFKFIFLISFLIFFLTGCSLQEENPKTIQDKTNEEISYIEDEIFTIVNKYIKGEYNDDTGGIKWDDVNKDGNHVQDKPEFVSFQILQNQFHLITSLIQKCCKPNVSYPIFSGKRGMHFHVKKGIPDCFQHHKTDIGTVPESFFYSVLNQHFISVQSHTLLPPESGRTASFSLHPHIHSAGE